MEWWTIIMLVVVILVILFPAAYVWDLNISGTYAAVKQAREKRAVRSRMVLDIKITDQGDYQGADKITDQGDYQGAEMTRMRRAAFGALFFLVAILFPVLIWVALFVAVREPLLRGVRWLSLAWHQMAGSKRAMRPIAYVPLFLGVAVLMPVLIWVAIAIAIRELSLRWRESRLPSALVCRLDIDCPPGYLCLAGRCVPQY